MITYNDAPQSVGLLWTNDQSVVENSTWQRTTLTTQKHPSPGWDSNPRVDVYYWNKVIANSASCLFILYGYITMHDQQNFKSLLRSPCSCVAGIKTPYPVSYNSATKSERKMPTDSTNATVSLRIKPEELWSHLLCGGRLISRILSLVRSHINTTVTAKLGDRFVKSLVFCCVRSCRLMCS